MGPSSKKLAVPFDSAFPVSSTSTRSLSKAMADSIRPTSSSSSSSSEGPEEENWSDWEEDQQKVTSLFDQHKLFDSPQLALEYDKSVHGVDLVLLGSTLDFFERIRLINWIRATKPDPKSLARLDRNAAFLQDDQWLKPIIEDDPLLQVDFDSLSLTSSSQPTSSQPPATSTENELITLLRAQLSDSNQALEDLKKLYTDRIGKGVWEEARDGGVAKKEGKEVERDDDSHYFESYAYNEIHEIMLKDRIRTDAYRNFILSNPSIFKDAIVLDVGCGSGILSMFAAQSGAKKVYAVDASAVAHKAERNVKDNGLSEVITVIKGKIEEIEIPEKVDVIVSEWMGYFLLYECMLDSVLSARTRFLKPSGLMVPSQCSIMLSLFDGAALVRDRIEFWNDVYGYKMDAMKDEIWDEAMIDVVGREEVVSDEISLSDIFTQTVTVPELSFTSSFLLTASKATKVHAFLGHFDTFFTKDGRPVSAEKGEDGLEKDEVFFTTGPRGTATHWKQTLFLLKEPLVVEIGTQVKGVFMCKKNEENSRELVVEMRWTVRREGEKEGEMKAQVWKVR